MTWENKQPQILSHPVRLRWAGWESDTYTLQQHGWEFSVCEDPMNRALQILLKNEKLRIQGRSERIQLDYIELMIDPEYVRDIILNCYLASQYQVLEEPSMTEILNMALKKQAPRQEEIRKQLLK